jgi:hypothetical protein
VPDLILVVEAFFDEHLGVESGRSNEVRVEVVDPNQRANEWVEIRLLEGKYRITIELILMKQIKNETKQERKGRKKKNEKKGNAPMITFQVSRTSIGRFHLKPTAR